MQRTRGTQGGVEEGRPTVEVERPTFEQHRDPHLRSRRQQFRDWDTAGSRRSEKRNKGPGWLSGGSEQITIVKSQNKKNITRKRNYQGNEYKQETYLKLFLLRPKNH